MNNVHPIHKLTAVLAALACILAALALYFAVQARSEAQLAGILSAGGTESGLTWSHLQEVRQDIQQLREELMAAGVIPEIERVPGPGEPTPDDGTD